MTVQPGAKLLPNPASSADDIAAKKASIDAIMEEMKTKSEELKKQLDKIAPKAATVPVAEKAEDAKDVKNATFSKPEPVATAQVLSAAEMIVVAG